MHARVKNRKHYDDMIFILRSSTCWTTVTRVADNLFEYAYSSGLICIYMNIKCTLTSKIVTFIISLFIHTTKTIQRIFFNVVYVHSVRIYAYAIMSLAPCFLSSVFVFVYFSVSNSRNLLFIRLCIWISYTEIVQQMFENHATEPFSSIVTLELIHKYTFIKCV